MNKQFESKLFKFKENNINTLDIYFGNATNKYIYNKKLDKDVFEDILQFIINKNYSVKHYNLKIYNYGIYFFDINAKKHWSKTNVSYYPCNDLLYITYLNNNEAYHNISCKQNYHIIEQHVNEFKINNELSILFINNSQIKINIKINHNIDLSIKKLKELLSVINYSQYL